MRFADKVVVVTGGSTGIGRACAQEFAAEGAAVVIADVNVQQGLELAAAIKAEGGRALFQHTDVSRDIAVERMVGMACERFGGIDYLVNSAAIQSYGSVVTTDEDTWNRTIDINLKGIYLAAKHCIPRIAQRGGGAVTSIASVQGLTTQPGVAAYTATKGAVIAMTRTMALDHADEGCASTPSRPARSTRPCCASRRNSSTRARSRRPWRPGARCILWGAWASRARWRAWCSSSAATTLPS